MANMKCESVCKMLKNYKLEFVSELTDDVKCGVCKGILVNAYQSPCACRFCLECISNYLNGEERLCPSEMDDCEEMKLDLKTDIHIDYVINKKISALSVKCPNESCTAIITLKNLEEHMSEHLIKCPYFDMGCSNSFSKNDEMMNHLHTDCFAHAVMVTKCIYNLKMGFADVSANDSEKNLLHNEIREVMKYIQETDCVKFAQIVRLKANLDQCLVDNLQLNGRVQSLQCDINSLKEESRRMEDLLVKLQRSRKLRIGKDGEVIIRSEEVASYRDDHRKLSEEMNARKNEIQTINVNLQLKQKLISKLERHIEELMILYTKIDRPETQEDIKNGDNPKYERAIDGGIFKKNMLEKYLHNLKGLQASCDINRTSIDIFDHNIEVRHPEYPTESEPLVLREDNVKTVPFEWKIESFMKKCKLAREGIDQYIMSGDFYSYKNGYKMILGVYPDGFDMAQGSYMSVFFHIAKGEHDDQLSWPMKDEILISLVDQETGCPYTTEKFKYETAEKSFLPSYHKPKSAINLGYGNTKFIELLILFKNKQLLKDDAIIIRCALGIT